LAENVDVSVLTPVLDEERYIRDAVRCMQEQTFRGGLELLFIDGRSRDRTREILEELACSDARIRVLDNPARATPDGLNIGLEAARGRYVARMDAHTHYPPGYLEAGVARLERGGADWVSGPQLATGVDPWSRRVALALSTALGTGGARFRKAMEQELEVDTGFTGIWLRSTLERYGGWDERWPVDQDYELAARMRKDGGRIVCIPEMAAAYIPRNSLRRLARQYWRYGFSRVRTSLAHPESMRPSHVLPPGLAVTTLAALLPVRALRGPARLGLGLYAAAIGVTAVSAARRAPVRDALALPLVFVTMHLAAGLGFLWAALRLGPPLAAARSAVGSLLSR
jgi:glycosyltransferase involved in cell wall biosynthesis